MFCKTITNVSRIFFKNQAWFGMATKMRQRFADFFFKSGLVWYGDKNAATFRGFF
jgi:hypothetical protein